MGLARVVSRAVRGIEAPEVIVEAHLSGGLPGISVVGLPEAAVREAKDRVRSALLTSGYKFPARRITVNLAPADLPKGGGRFDLPIAIGILVASGQVPDERLKELELIGELALDGALRPCRGVLSAGLAASRAGRRLIVPQDNGAEASLARDCEVRTANHLLAVADYLRGNDDALPIAEPSLPAVSRYPLDLSDVRGQLRAKRALEIAAAGGHSMLMIGPPGSGKSMLAARMPTIQPSMTDEEALEAATVHSISRTGFDVSSWGLRPFRSPHHSASGPALVGGGANPGPGEISLAHHGVLFLDELTEFDRRVLEVLREPLETGEIHISRANAQASFPARFQLVAAMNPCQCGYLGDRDQEKHCPGCTAEQIRRYRGKLSGPLLDRIDLHVDVPRVAAAELAVRSDASESSAAVSERVARARRKQIDRQRVPNARLSVSELDNVCALNESVAALMTAAVDRLGMSGRAAHRSLKVARTIADLAGEPEIGAAQLSEALTFRPQAFSA